MATYDAGFSPKMIQNLFFDQIKMVTKSTKPLISESSRIRGLRHYEMCII